ncbi:MAG: PEP-utilizing enzyme, partial [Mycobacterium leprae]
GRPDRVLSDGEAEELARLTTRVLWALGDGETMQDVEWAHDGRQFWLLQARPVTAAARVTYSPVAHLPVIWSNANLKDVVPGVPTTLSWNLLQSAVRYILYAAPEAAGYPVPAGMEVLRRIAGRGYFDLTSVFWAYYDAFGFSPATVNMVIGGSQPEIPVPTGNPLRGRAGWRRLTARLRLVWSIWRDAGAYGVHIRRFRESAKHLKSRDLVSQSREELLALLREINAAMMAFGPRYQLGNASGSQMEPLTALLERHLPGRGQAVASGLMAGSGQVVSAEHGYRVYDLARAAAGDAAARAWLAAEPLDPTGWQHLSATSPFRRELEGFLDEFGHRALYELELANPRWHEEPTYILQQVRSVLTSGVTTSPAEAAQAARRRAEAEVDRLPLLSRLTARWLAARCRQGWANREAGKSAIVAMWEPTRQIMLAIGRRLTDAGKLTNGADLFHLSLSDVVAYLLGEWDGTGAAAIAADHQARREAWLVESPADIVILDAAGRPATLPANPGVRSVEAPPGSAARTDGSLAGVAVSAGRATGRVRIIRHPAEGERLEPGEILVAPSTDPGWTPLFLRAAAVAMEVGGYLSHGAIVAREYGIPAVANVPGLLERLRDGEVITVDGDAGLVIPAGK